jgi:hypothetical protein
MTTTPSIVLSSPARRLTRHYETGELARRNEVEHFDDRRRVSAKIE